MTLAARAAPIGQMNVTSDPTLKTLSLWKNITDFPRPVIGRYDAALAVRRQEAVVGQRVPPGGYGAASRPPADAAARRLCRFFLAVTSILISIIGCSRGVGMQGRGEREIPEQNRRPAASSCTIYTCVNQVLPRRESNSVRLGGRRNCCAIKLRLQKMRSNMYSVSSAGGIVCSRKLLRRRCPPPPPFPLSNNIGFDSFQISRPDARSDSHDVAHKARVTRTRGMTNSPRHRRQGGGDRASLSPGILGPLALHSPHAFAPAFSLSLSLLAPDRDQVKQDLCSPITLGRRMSLPPTLHPGIAPRLPSCTTNITGLISWNCSPIQVLVSPLICLHQTFSGSAGILSELLQTGGNEKCSSVPESEVGEGQLPSFKSAHFALNGLYLCQCAKVEHSLDDSASLHGRLYGWFYGRFGHLLAVSMGVSVIGRWTFPLTAGHCIPPLPHPRLIQSPSGLNRISQHKSRNESCTIGMIPVTPSDVARLTYNLRRCQRTCNAVHTLAPPPAGSPDFHKWESCRTIPMVGGSSRGSSVSPAPSFWRRSMFTSITLIDSQDLATFIPTHRGSRTAKGVGVIDLKFPRDVDEVQVRYYVIPTRLPSHTHSSVAVSFALIRRQSFHSESLGAPIFARTLVALEPGGYHRLLTLRASSAGRGSDISSGQLSIVSPHRPGDVAATGSTWRRGGSWPVTPHRAETGRALQCLDIITAKCAIPTTLYLRSSERHIYRREQVFCAAARTRLDTIRVLDNHKFPLLQYERVFGSQRG
ncbi:hypothetical protein PR048_003188 [Dryococelus australis]|uniref:Uncharacterized protein n=1 Tax=Dryococelus australis TaxID=614101 RepID=A0ABQ9INT8_9NEOP|nr:hypothetical protein PR048_003188 [Dryococelus australis]